MAAFSGTTGSVIRYSGTANTPVLRLSEWSMDFSMSPVETTEFSDSFDDYVPSVRTVTGSFSGFQDDTGTGTGQPGMTSSWSDGTSFNLRLGEKSGNFWEIPNCLVTGQSDSIGVKGVPTVSWSFQSNGTITYTGT